MFEKNEGNNKDNRGEVEEELINMK